MCQQSEKDTPPRVPAKELFRPPKVKWRLIVDEHGFDLTDETPHTSVLRSSRHE